METVTHEIVGIIEGDSPSDLAVRVRPISSRASFVKKPRELYTKQWLSSFSHEDVAYLGFLHAAVYGDGLIPVRYFPRKMHRLTNSVLLIAVLFVCFSIMSNMTAYRLSSIDLSWIPVVGGSDVRFPSGLVLFPTTYAFSTILTEVYGYSISRLVIWCGLGANLLLLAGLFAISLIPTSYAWAAQSGFSDLAYHAFLIGYAKTFAASSVAYFFSEFINTAVLAKLKVASAGRYKVLRIFASTGLAVCIDSTIFCSILFFGALSPARIGALILIQVALKCSYELIFLPTIVPVSRYLKIRDGIDYYDFDTNFNPFVING